MSAILNVGVLADVDAGKTTLTEQLLYQSGELRKAGSVDDGTAQTDFMEIERARGISVRTSSATFYWKDTQFNLIDTPGHVDFVAEVERALSVLDLAVLVVSAVDGVQSHTEILYDALQKTGTGTVIFINKIDQTGSQVERVLKQISERFGKPVLCCSMVDGECTRECQVKQHEFSEPEFGEQAVESMAESDDKLMEQYLSGEEISSQQLAAALREQLAQGKILPVLCGSAMLGIGVRQLMDFLADYGTAVKNQPGEELSGVVYKITHDKTMGRIAHVRLFSGQIKNRDSVMVSSQSEPVKISQVRRYSGARFSDLGEAAVGDVVALCGMNHVRVGDIIGQQKQLPQCRIAMPLMKVNVIPPQPDQLYQLFSVLEEIAAEDPQLDLEYYPEEKEISISITGKIQLEILAALLKERYQIEVSFSSPTIIYRETPSRAGRGYDAYTMPKPCWAIIELQIEPLKPGSGYQFESVVPNDQIFYRYQRHIETELPRALKQGLYNWQVVDLKVTLTGGSHHTVHTHPLDFFLATPLALMNGLQNTGTTLLEPMQYMRISAPEEFLGKVFGDMIAMRGTYDSPVIRDGIFTLEAKVPAAESMDYAIRLASMTSGKGVLSVRFAGYEPCPLELGKIARRHGVNPLDRDRWILTRRNAMG